MKKIINVILLLVIMMSLVGCGKILTYEPGSGEK